MDLDRVVLFWDGDVLVSYYHFKLGYECEYYIQLHAVIVSMTLTRPYKKIFLPPFSIFYAIYETVLT